MSGRILEDVEKEKNIAIYRLFFFQCCCTFLLIRFFIERAALQIDLVANRANQKFFSLDSLSATPKTPKKIPRDADFDTKRQRGSVESRRLAEGHRFVPYGFCIYFLATSYTVNLILFYFVIFRVLCGETNYK